jgi:pentatricopeptide repeat protein
MDLDTLTAALRRELDGYIRRGMTERAEAVRQELIRLGCSDGVTPREVVPPEADGPPPAPRKTPTKRKAAKS